MRVRLFVGLMNEGRWWKEEYWRMIVLLVSVKENLRLAHLMAFGTAFGMETVLEWACRWFLGLVMSMSNLGWLVFLMVYLRLERRWTRVASCRSADTLRYHQREVPPQY